MIITKTYFSEPKAIGLVFDFIDKEIDSNNYKEVSISRVLGKHDHLNNIDTFVIEFN